ncbi:MAG: serine hydrolase [Cyanobacteriota bacterium]|nr:serine hydrolase [Cyanobacteriota bacterium]
MTPSQGTSPIFRASRDRFDGIPSPDRTSISSIDSSSASGLSRFGDPRFRQGKRPKAKSQPIDIQRSTPSPDVPVSKPIEFEPRLDRPTRTQQNGTRSRSTRLDSRASNSRPLPPLTSKPDRADRHKSKPTKTAKAKPPSKPKSPIFPLVYLTRLLIWGVGMSAISGTVLALWNPAGQSPTTIERSQSSNASNARPSLDLPLAQEIGSLKASIETVTAAHPQLTPGVFLVDVDTGDYLNLNGDRAFAAASTIKVPILVAFFQAVDAGRITLDETLTLQSKHIAGGSGAMQDDPIGTTYTALEVATATIVSSDNTATNILIDRLGGIEPLNLMFQNWGLADTSLRNLLPDLEGTNQTTPRDLTRLMSSIERGELISRRSRDRLLDIMQATQNDSLLPQGLGAGASIAHKTGTLKSVLADMGIVDLPSGKRYIVVAIVKREESDEQAAEVIRQISSTTYEHFTNPEVAQQTEIASPTVDEFRAGSAQPAWKQNDRSN